MYMAARSNHFRVRDEPSFLAWVETLPGVSAHRDTPMNHPDDPADHPNPSYALLADQADGAWPTWRDVALNDCDAPTEQLEMDWAAELSPHLAEGEVAVLEEVGADKLRYLFAHATAVNHRGEAIELNLSRIYGMVQEAGWGQNVSEAVY